MRFTPFSSQLNVKSTFGRLGMAVLFAFLVTPGGFSQTASSEFERVSLAATRAREVGKNTEAIQLYKKSVELEPNWAEGWWYLGTMQYDVNHFAEAIPAFRALTKLGPQ